MRSRFGTWPWLVVIILVGGCGRELPPVGLAQGQVPVAGSPALAWQDAAARCTVDASGVRLSCRAVVRRAATGAVRLALLTDAGLLLCDVAVDDGRPTVHREIADLAGRGAGLGLLAWQAWGASSRPEAGTWTDGAWLVQDGGRQRWFAGDPLVLRQVDGQGPAAFIGDYRPWAAGLLAHQVQQAGPGFSVTVQLRQPLAAGR